MKEYLEGYQSATIDCIKFGVDFANKVIKEFVGDDDYVRGYTMGVKMFEDRELLHNAINEELNERRGQ